MKTESGVQNVPFSGRKRGLIEDARKERETGAPSPGPSRYADNFVFEEKDGKVTLIILFALSHEKNPGLSKTTKVFEVYENLAFFLRPELYNYRIRCYRDRTFLMAKMCIFCPFFL